MRHPLSPRALLRSALVVVMCAMAVGSSACAGEDGSRDTGGDDTTEGASGPERWVPEADVTWQWQLSVPDGASPTLDYDVDVYDLDLFETSEASVDSLHDEGHHVICYFSAGSSERNRDDFDRFIEAEQGNQLDGWPDERWLDLNSTNVRSVMEDRLDAAVAQGCDAVEPDNTDGYDSTAGGGSENGLGLTEADTLNFLRWLADEAHQRGLSIGLKNTLGLVEELAATYDFAVNEQCHQFGECGELSPFVDLGKPVLNAEYVDGDTFLSADAARAEVCRQAAAAGTATLILPLDLDDSFRVGC